MSDQPPAPPRYDLDQGHDRMFLELTDASGRVIASVPVPAPLNKNVTIPVSVQVTIAHEDGCAKTIGSWQIPPY